MTRTPGPHYGICHPASLPGCGASRRRERHPGPSASPV